MAEKAAAKLLTIQELSINSRLSIATLHRLKRQGKLPFLQPAGKGGRLLFPPDAIERCAAADFSEQITLFTPAAKPPRQLSGPRPGWMQSTNSPKEER